MKPAIILRTCTTVKQTVVFFALGPSGGRGATAKPARGGASQTDSTERDPTKAAGAFKAAVAKIPHKRGRRDQGNESLRFFP